MLAVRSHPAAGPLGLARRVLLSQLLLGAMAIPAVATVGGAGPAVSVLLGLLSVAIPQWCAHQLLRWVSPVLPRLMALEGLRVGTSIALLLWGARSVPGFAWWGALIGLVLAVKAPWLVLLREDRRT